MHISDGVLPLTTVMTTYGVSAVIAAWSLKSIHEEDLPKIAVVTSSFFVASLIHLPLGPTSVHLLLPGVVGALLGPAAFISICIGLFLQSILFQFGGLTALGANALVMGLPALLCGLLFRHLQGTDKESVTRAGVLCGGLGTLLSALILAGLLVTGGEDFFATARLAAIAHLPVIFVEALVCAFTVRFIFRVRPQMLPGLSRQ
ncbi:MAG: cobalamin biosynthesis protein CbiM [Deltaproteobacteria bacterium]|nr:MAG: cobalamin biosynthesis protein CbiM [Deltaproteobacteria bacterium]